MADEKCREWGRLLNGRYFPRAKESLHTAFGNAKVDRAWQEQGGFLPLAFLLMAVIRRHITKNRAEGAPYRKRYGEPQIRQFGIATINRNYTYGSK